MNQVSENELSHYGIPKRSGRYPWGSGDDPYQHGRDFLSRIDELKKQGWKETPENIKNEFGLNTSQYRTEKALANSERRRLNVARAKSLKEDGLGDSEIGRQMGVNESTVRSWLKADSEVRMNKAVETAEFLKKKIKEHEADGGMIDVGKDVNRSLNISKEKLDQALYLLEKEGYHVYGGRTEQVTNWGNFTTQKVLCPPGTEHKDIFNNWDKVHSVEDYISRDNGETYEKKFHYPESLDSKRLKIRYNEDGGVEKDGVIELRRGVDDLSLGESRYSQVRILVDKTHYLKGMAVYADNMPDGVDVIFNTNKKKGTPMEKVLKEIKSDPDNPFGSAIKDADQGGQYWYTDKNGKRKLGLINKRADEGDWTEWQDSLPSQFLGKQPLSMAKKQLNLAKADKLAEFDEICKINNPTIKKHLLEKFADSCDAAAVDLKAAALPGQKYHVIIPINSLKDNEVYAPGYEPGTQLALIRYPHGGTFEIPIATVTHKNPTAKKVIGTTSIDAIGINSKVAERLSGADFDGDTVMCIPTHDKAGKVKIKSTPPLKGLEGFDPKTKYGCDLETKDSDGTEHYYRNGNEFRRMTKKGTQTQMGIISNLITDMTLAGANDTELAQAVRHSMVVIDAHKHKLDYKQSEMDNNIPALHKKYQGKTTGGAATILSKSKGQQDVPKRKGSPHVNVKGSKWYDPTKPEGALIYQDDPDATYTVTKTNKRTGGTTEVTKTRTQKSTKMAETDDAYKLVSDAKHPMELVYADYANSMKTLANRARMEIVNTPDRKYSASAKATYRKEVSSLDEKLNTAELNKIRERSAQRKAYMEVKNKREAAKKAGSPMDTSDVKKAGQQALTKYRSAVGSVSRKDRSIKVTDREWEAIQAGAVSPSKLKRILNNSDVDDLRRRATPRSTKSVSSAQINRIKAMSNSNYSLSEIAKALNLPTSTVSNYIKN